MRSKDHIGGLTLEALGLSAVEQKALTKALMGCELQLSLTPTQHLRLEQENLFGLQPESRTAFSSRSFEPESPIEAIITLDPQYLELIEPFEDEAAVAEFLLAEAPASTFWKAESWMLLKASQHNGSNETSYRTAWDYFDFAALGDRDDPEAALLEIMGSFLADADMSGQLAKALGASPAKTSEIALNITQSLLESLPGLAHQDADEMAPLREVLSQTYEQSLSTNLENLSSAIADIAETEDAANAITDMSDFLKQNKNRPSSDISTKSSLLESVKAFFESENWPYEQIEGEPILRSLFTGKTGRRTNDEGKTETWLCLTEVKDSANQLAFYSIGSMPVPPERRADVAALFMRLNYQGTHPGSFELDFSDGEFRYRTTIDVTDSAIDRALIKNVVYNNVLTVEKYWPMIMDAIAIKTPLKAFMKSALVGQRPI